MWPNNVPTSLVDWTRLPAGSYLRTLLDSHKVYIEVCIMNMEHYVIANASDRLISGKVDMDSSAHITRSGTVQLWDPGNEIGLALGGTSQYNRMIQINYWVAPLDYSAWHRTAIATCVVTNVERDGGIINVEFKGKEVLADHASYTGYTWPAGWAKSSVIMNAMTIFTGEHQFWDYTGGLGWNMLWQNWSIESGDNLWSKLQELVRSYGARMHYNGEGILHLQPLDPNTRFTIDSTMLTGEPTMAFDIDNLYNMVRVEGAMIPTWDGGEMRLIYEAWPPAHHPFSPQALARWGWPRTIAHVIKDEQITDINTAVAIAWSELSAALVQTNDVQATAKVLPFLEEWDVVTISHPKFYGHTFVNKWTIPLVGDGEQSFNFMSNTSFAYTGGLAGGGISKQAVDASGRMKTHVGGSGHPGRRRRKHGASGAFNTVGGRNIDKMKGENWYGGKGSKKGNKNKDKKGNKDRGKKGRK